MPGPVSNFNAVIVPMLQQNYLQKALQAYLFPNVQYLHAAMKQSVSTHIGDTLTMTRPGLLSARPDPVDPSQATGLDNNITPRQWALEQYTLTLQLFDDAQDIDLMTKTQSIVDRFAHSVRTNMIASIQSLDVYNRNCLFGGLVPSGANQSSAIKEGYLAGNTFATAATTASTTVHVDDVTGFTTALVNGVLTNVSAQNPISIYQNGVVIAAQVVGVAIDTPNQCKRVFQGTTGAGTGAAGNWVGGQGVSGTLTLNANATFAAYDVITAADAPAIFRPNGKTSYQRLAASDTLGQANILDAVAYLRNAQVPAFDENDAGEGNYLMICDYVSMRQLFGDNDFKIAFQGLGQSKVFKNAKFSEYLGVHIIQSSNAPVQAAYTAGNYLGAAVTVRRPIIMGKDALVWGHFEGIEDFGGIGRNAAAAYADGAQMSFIETTPVGLAYVVRPPLDRLGRFCSLAWQGIGDAIAPTDLTANSNIVLTGNNARRKRCAIIEHAG